MFELAPSGTSPSAAGPVYGVVADSGGNAKTPFVWDPSTSALFDPVKKSYSDAVEGAGGAIDVMGVSSSNIGKSIPGQVVSYLQSHPQRDLRGLQSLGRGHGRPAGDRSRRAQRQGQDRQQAPSATTMADVKSGARWATVREENSAGGYQAIDQLERIAGVDLGDLRDAVGWHQIFTKANVVHTDAAPGTPGVPEAFLTAWKVGS